MLSRSINWLPRKIISYYITITKLDGMQGKDWLRLLLQPHVRISVSEPTELQRGHCLWVVWYLCARFRISQNACDWLSTNGHQPIMRPSSRYYIHQLAEAGQLLQNTFIHCQKIHTSDLVGCAVYIVTVGHITHVSVNFSFHLPEFSCYLIGWLWVDVPQN